MRRRLVLIHRLGASSWRATRRVLPQRRRRRPSARWCSAAIVIQHPRHVVCSEQDGALDVVDVDVLFDDAVHVFEVL